MKRVNIRDNRVEGKYKPRVCDLIIRDDGTQELEYKHGRIKTTILVDDLTEQISEAQKKV